MIIDKLNSILNSTEPSDIHHTIAYVMKDNMSIMSKLTIGELANQCHVSKSMISKFTKELGYESYIELKEDCGLYQKYSDSIAMLEFPHSFQDSCHSYAKLFYDTMLSVLEQLDFLQLDQLIENMNEANRIYLYGNDKDHLICQKLQKDLDPFGKPTTILDTDLKHSHIEENSMFFIFYTCDDMYMNSQVLKKLQKHQYPIWMITTKSIDNPYVHLIQLPQTQIAIDNNLAYLFIDMIVSRFYQVKIKVHKT